jgi:bifunctional UDP-N-acetylglucosamine pyrophosphorylase/glucosamine-1-phosphate N-acetyltransferase
MALTAIILAAGEGKRMRSRQPKVLHRLCGRPLVGYPVRLARALADRIVVVTPPDGDEVRRAAGDDVVAVEQRARLGTGHAVLQARDACRDASSLLVLPGDVPLLGADSVERLLTHHRVTGAAATLLTAVVDAPAGYGRVLRQRGRVARIVEERDATDDQKKIAEINTGVYCFEAARLWAALEQVRPDNDQGEYYLPDVVEILARAGARVEGVPVGDPAEALGVNDRRQLAAVSAIRRRRILDALMESGVTIVDPSTTYVDDTVSVGADTILYPHVTLEGATEIGAGCVIGAGCQVTDTRLAEGVRLKPYCVLGASVVEEGAELGPFCHLRPRSRIGAGARVGNFVEVKQSTLGRGAKANHLAYIGDATVGEHVNIGAGAITCNYDGERKHQTIIGDGAFVGTNASLVAPLVVGEGAYIGSGSVITRDVPPGALALERSVQTVKEGWVAQRKARPRRKDG